MTISDTTGEMNSLYKVNYAQKMKDLIPKTGRLTKKTKFNESAQNGKFFELPVIVTAENGFTYSLETQDAFALNSSRGMNMQSAQVPGADLVLGATIGYSQAARAAHSKTAFKTVMGTKLENMILSHTKRLEINYFYGQDSLSTAAAQPVTIASSMLPIVFDAASWAVGMWAGSEDSLVVFSKDADDAVVDSLLPYRIARIGLRLHSCVTCFLRLPTANLCLTLAR